MLDCPTAGSVATLLLMVTLGGVGGLLVALACWLQRGGGDD
jgi:hypothetical protein